MITFVVKNLGDSPLLLQFDDETRVKLRPHGLHVWQGPSVNTERLQEYVDEGRLEVTVFEYDLTGKGIHPRKQVDFDWSREGF
jgi:hypothetical protein